MPSFAMGPILRSSLRIEGAATSPSPSGTKVPLVCARWHASGDEDVAAPMPRSLLRGFSCGFITQRLGVGLSRNDAVEVRCRALACERQSVRKQTPYKDTWGRRLHEEISGGSIRERKIEFFERGAKERSALRRR